MRTYWYSVISFCVLITLCVFSLRFVTNTWVLSFLYSFQLHFAALTIVASLLCFCLQRSFFSSLLLLLSSCFVGYTLYLHFKHVSTEDTLVKDYQVLKVMSFNVLGENRQTELLSQVIVNSNADIAVLLESPPLKPQLENALSIYPYRVGCGVKTKRCDLMILSKLPIEQSGISSLAGPYRERFQWVEVQLNSDLKINIVAAHLGKPYHDDEHQVQLRDLYKKLKKIDKPFILAGDFNSGIYSPSMQHFLNANNLNVAIWEPATWPITVDRFGIPIDHIFTRAPYQIRNLKRLPGNYGSNHYGLIAEILIPGD